MVTQRASSEAEFQAILRRYNLAALIGPFGAVYGLDSVKSGETYYGVARAPPAASRPPEPAKTVTLRLDAVADRAFGGRLEWRHILRTDEALEGLLRAYEAAGLVRVDVPGEEAPLLAAAAAADRVVIRHVGDLEKGGTYLVVPAFGGAPRDEARALVGLPLRRGTKGGGCRCRRQTGLQPTLLRARAPPCRRLRPWRCPARARQRHSSALPGSAPPPCSPGPIPTYAACAGRSASLRPAPTARRATSRWMRSSSRMPALSCWRRIAVLPRLQSLTVSLRLTRSYTPAVA